MACSRRPALPPAFDLSAVLISNEEHRDDLGVCAARCEPMSEIQDFLYIGTWKDVADINALRSRGITHILNAAKELDDSESATTLGELKTLHIPLVDKHEQPENLEVFMDKAYRFIEEARMECGKCLVHCRRGISRSPAIVVGYIMRHRMQSYEVALNTVKQRRSCVSLNMSFQEFLSAYVPPSPSSNQSPGNFGCHLICDSIDGQPTPGHSDTSTCDSLEHPRSQ